MPDWTPPASDKVAAQGWTPPAADKVAAGSDIPLLGRVTPDMSDHDILTNGLGYSEAKAKEIMSAPGYKSGMLKGAVTDPNSFAGTVGHTVLGSIYKGAIGDSSAALDQIVSHVKSFIGTGDPKDADLSDAMAKLWKANYQQNWKGNTSYNAATGQGSHTSATDMVGQGLGSAIPFIASEGKNPASLPATLFSKEALPVVGKMAAQGGVFGALQPVTENTDNFAGQKAEQIGLGAAGGAVGGVVGQKVIGPVAGKIINATAGRLAPAYQEIQSLADKYGVPISFPQASSSPMMKKTGAVLNEIPVVGTSGFQTQQQGAVKQAAQNFLGDFQAKAPSGDWTDNIQGALQGKFQDVRTQKNALYDAVANAAGDSKIPLPKVNASLDAAEDAIRRSAIPNGQVLKTIQDLRANLNPGRTVAGQFAPASADTSFTGLQLTRSDLGDAINSLYKTGQDKEAKVLSGVRDALNQDMGTFAKSRPDLAGAWKDADSFYKGQYVPLKDKAIQNAMKSATPDEITSHFIQAGKGDRAANFYNALTPDGQASLRVGLIQKAIDGATAPDTGVFSPAKFAGYFDKMNVPASQVFKGEDKWALDGFTKLMRATSSAGEMGPGPKTGFGTIMPGALLTAGAGAVAAPGTTAASAGSVFALSKLFTTPAGKRLLMAASDLPAGSPKLVQYAQKAMQLIPAAVGASTVGGKAGMALPQVAQNDQPAPEQIAQAQ